MRSIRELVDTLGGVFQVASYAVSENVPKIIAIIVAILAIMLFT